MLEEEELKKVVSMLCRSKAEEFEMLGYHNITGNDVWKCIHELDKKEDKPLFRTVNDILSLKVTTFMDYAAKHTV